MKRTALPCLSARCSARIRPERTSPGAPGFSLIELLVTIAIVAILLSIALPNMSDAIARSRIASSANDFIAGLNYARTEAIRRNGIAGVCPTASGVVCDGAWGDRWLVFFGDPGKPTVLSIGEFSKKDQFTSESPTNKSITFDARGMLTTAPNAFELRPVDCGVGKPMRRFFSVHRTGNVSVMPGACL